MSKKITQSECQQYAINAIKKNQAKSFDQMVTDARKIHGDKYEYDKETYSNVRTKMKIICPTHGEFWQTPHKHINAKNGCPKCKGGVKLTQSEFLKKAEKILNGKYDLSKAKYVNSTTKITITCQKHGDFSITPHSLLQGHGCPKCSEEKKGSAQKYNMAKVMEMARNVHGNKYIYAEANYINANTPIKIICPIHGEFWQTPSKHIHGKHGCPKCSQSHLEEEMSNFLSENNIKHNQSQRFDWLGFQHLDFYLPKYNVAIECQGDQHYKPISFNEDKSKETLEKIFTNQQERDQRKKRLCEEHGVKLLYYTTYNKVNEDGITFKDKDKLLSKLISYGIHE